MGHDFVFNKMVTCSQAAKKMAQCRWEKSGKSKAKVKATKKNAVTPEMTKAAEEKAADSGKRYMNKLNQIEKTIKHKAKKSIRKKNLSIAAKISGRK